MVGTISTTADLAILEVKHYREIGATSGERWEDGKLPPRKQLTRSLEILWPAKPSTQVFLWHCVNARSGAAFPRGLTLYCLPAWQRFTPGSMWLERKINIPSVCCTALLHLLHTCTCPPHPQNNPLKKPQDKLFLFPVEITSWENQHSLDFRVLILLRVYMSFYEVFHCK